MTILIICLIWSALALVVAVRSLRATSKAELAGVKLDNRSSAEEGTVATTGHVAQTDTDVIGQAGAYVRDVTMPMDISKKAYLTLSPDDLAQRWRHVKRLARVGHAEPQEGIPVSFRLSGDIHTLREAFAAASEHHFAAEWLSEEAPVEKFTRFHLIDDRDSAAAPYIRGKTEFAPTFGGSFLAAEKPRRKVASPKAIEPASIEANRFKAIH